ncbi:MAG: hypothetical protein V4510_09705 [bacterium]
MKIDKDGWYRIARKGRALPIRPGFDNLYRTKTGALAAIRAIRRRRGGEQSAHTYIR